MRQIEITHDGSATLYHAEIDEHYHSCYGARAESQHVFITHGLARAQEAVNGGVTLLEVGLGTGLNALLSLLHQQANRGKVRYVSYELYPLSIEELAPFIATFPPHEADLLSLIHRAEWEVPTEILPGFTLIKREADILTASLPPSSVNVVYMDAFSPEKVPELWSEKFFARLYAMCAPGAVLSTYCAKGEVRRRLQRVGFTVERTPGPSGGKREILVALR